MDLDMLSKNVIGLTIEVHKNLGPGLLEKTYEECLCLELEESGFNYKKQVVLPITYKGKIINDAYRIDILVEDALIIELKTVQTLEKIHKSQLLTYLKLSDKKLGLLINFNVPLLKEGIVRVVNSL